MRFYYNASKLTYGGIEPCQWFVANAELPDETIFQADVSPEFKPYRRLAKYRRISEVDIRPLIDSLEFIKNKKSWGYSFRFGLVEIKEQDYNLILKYMLPSNE